MATTPGNLFTKKRESEIGMRNLELINDAPSMANFTKIQDLSNRPSVVKFSPAESKSVTKSTTP